MIRLILLLVIITGTGHFESSITFLAVLASPIIGEVTLLLAITMVKSILAEEKRHLQLCTRLAKQTATA
jgi:transcriptional regulator of acetoin/glycerol metabolism